jgi:F-type H+-transporting ATPase subunit b
MEEIIKAFGIDGRLIIIQLINFGILMAALGYFLYTPILKMLAEREAKIAQGLKDAETAAQAKAEASLEKQNILTKAHSAAEEINKRAKVAADVQATEIVSGAQVKASQVLEDAEKKREFIKEQARQESEKEIAQIAVLAAEKVLRAKA